MAKINLLPWRAERRERRKREFFSHLVIAAVAAIVLVLLWGFWMSLRINNQDSRNAYLTSQIHQLDAKITEIKNLRKVKDRLLSRKKIVEQLQSSRSQMVHLFDQIVDTIPAGARLTGLKEVENQNTETLTLDGVAQSNATVAQYMKNIEASPWMGPAQLVKTENVHADSNTPYEFELVVTLGMPKSDAKGTPATGSSSAAPAPASTSAPASAPAAAVAAASGSATAQDASTGIASAKAPASAPAMTSMASPAMTSKAPPAASDTKTPATKASDASAAKGGAKS
ncbi:MAG TPA: PilN domain-containing protein [Rhodanobacteraceae bacterium]|nr:PilN domain-containing protein [Rhodanobacteraceae bacterium]